MYKNPFENNNCLLSNDLREGGMHVGQSETDCNDILLQGIAGLEQVRMQPFVRITAWDSLLLPRTVSRTTGWKAPSWTLSVPESFLTAPQT